MKNNYRAFTFVALVATLQLHAPGVSEIRLVEAKPEPVISVDGNLIKAQEGAVAAHFEPSSTTAPYIFKGKITGLTISEKTSSSTIAANISKQLKTPLSFSEQSLLQKALDIGRLNKGWDSFNAQLESILNIRTGKTTFATATFSEHQLLDALKNAENTGSLVNIYNKTKSFFGSFANSISGKVLTEKLSGEVITFEDPKSQAAQAKTVAEAANIKLQSAQEKVNRAKAALNANPTNLLLKNQFQMANNELLVQKTITDSANSAATVTQDKLLAHTILEKTPIQSPTRTKPAQQQRAQTTAENLTTQRAAAKTASTELKNAQDAYNGAIDTDPGMETQNISTLKQNLDLAKKSAIQASKNLKLAIEQIQSNPTGAIDHSGWK